MKALTLAIVICLSASSAMAGNYVKGYTKKDGTYVQPHYRSSPNSSKYDNYSTKGNSNPYTGKAGTVDPHSSSYGSGSSYGNSYRSNSSGGRSTYGR